MKLGSLFDGSGGFPLAGTLCGITPVFASEIEPYPIAVTTSRFPNMRHYGDVSKVNGSEIEPVDVLTFGSPCQDLSVAGKRAGLKHTENGDEETTRSGLFMEAVRIIKEMRKATNGLYPTFVLWENVPGAFSSNGGDDFRIVLEELIKVVEPSATVPAPEKGGWPYADAYVGDGWSLAYRVFDAQYWGRTIIDRDSGTILRRGTPQRRRRIYLVADFRGERAAEILFEREGLRGNPPQSGTPRQETAADAERSAGADDREGIGLDLYNFGVTGDIAVTLNANSGQSANHAGPTVAVPIREGEENDVIAIDQQGGKGSANFAVNVMPTICSDSHGTPHAVCYPETANALTARYDGSPQPDKGNGVNIVAYSFDSLASNSMKSKNPHSGCREVEISKCLDTTDPNPSKNQGGIAIVECYDARGNGDGKTASTITGDHENRITDYTNVIAFAQNQRDEVRDLKGKAGALAAEPGAKQQTYVAIPEEETPVYCLQGNGIDRADTAGCNGKGWREDQSYTLNTIDRPAVAYATDVGFFESLENKAPSLLARGYKDPHLVTYPCNWDGSQTTGTLTANNAGGNQRMPDKENFNAVIERENTPPPRYIVRRLTPTECARLQGFPDTWGHPDHKDTLTDEEYQFWLEVRNTHAAINGKQVKEYTREQILKWYNGLHTDSAEYKMWGNGIALPTALYVMQGIAEKLQEQE